MDLFIDHLSGEKDVTWKYLFLIRKLLNRFDIFDIYRYRQILQTLYPNRTKEMYDQIELEFISYSKNHVNKELVEEHIVHLLQSNLEPNYRFVSVIFLYKKKLKRLS